MSAGLGLAIWITSAVIVVVAFLAGLVWLVLWVLDRLAGWHHRRRARGQPWRKR